MSTPGATISGLISRSWPIRGPRELNTAASSCLSTAPTVSALVAAPGVLIVPSSGPAFPAATTNSVPVSSVSRSTAWLSGSVPSVEVGEPRLMFTTSAPLCAAHSMPAMIWSKEPLPPASSTLPISNAAPGATPVPSPRVEPSPVPATVDATWVPCPLSSMAPSEVPVKSCTPLTCSARSGCSGS